MTGRRSVEEHEGAENDTQGVDRLEAEDMVIAVTGGTGNYRYARSEATFGLLQKTSGTVITYELDT